MSKYGIAYQPLSQTIEIGQLNKANTRFREGKEDHTGRAIRAVAELVLANFDGGLTIDYENGESYDIVVQARKP